MDNPASTQHHNHGAKHYPGAHPSSNSALEARLWATMIRGLNFASPGGWSPSVQSFSLHSVACSWPAPLTRSPVRLASSPRITMQESHAGVVVKGNLGRRGSWALASHLRLHWRYLCSVSATRSIGLRPEHLKKPSTESLNTSQHSKYCDTLSPELPLTH